MKIAIFEVEDWEMGAFEALSKAHDVVITHGHLTKENAHEYADREVVSTFIYSDLSRETIKELKELRLIATRSTGFDHIDTAYCVERGIRVANVPAYGDNTVAEHVFGLILAVSHRLVDAVERTRRGEFTEQGLMGFDLKDKTLGVIGTGAIGRYVIEIAKGFRMKVLAFDKYPNDIFASRMGFRYAPLDEVLSASDIITLHLPALPETHHFLSEREFDLMKKGVVVINTARGSLIDIQALLKAVSSGKVSAVGLDVLPEEPTIREEAELIRSIAQRRPLESLLADHILLRLRNVVITPHSAFYTREAVQRILDTTIENISAYMNAEPRNLVVGGS